MKFSAVVIGLAIMAVIFTACQPLTTEGTYYEVQKKLLELKSYQCTARIYVQSQHRKQEYVFRQFFKYPDQYRLEVVSPKRHKGNLIVYNGRIGWLHYPSINQTWRINNFQQSQEQLMFIGYFLQNYISSLEPQIEEDEIDGKKYIVINTKVPGGNFYVNNQKLWICKKGLIPVKLYIFDKQQNIRFRVYFEDFKFNPELKDEIFYLSLDKAS